MAAPLDAGKIRDILSCPITYELMQDPVIDKCGHTFERVDIVAWLETQPRCPLSNEELTVSDLRPNYAIKDVLEVLAHQKPGTALEEDEKEIVEAGVSLITAQRTTDAAAGILDRLPPEERRPSLATRVRQSIKAFYSC